MLHCSYACRQTFHCHSYSRSNATSSARAPASSRTFTPAPWPRQVVRPMRRLLPSEMARHHLLHEAAAQSRSPSIYNCTRIQARPNWRVRHPPSSMQRISKYAFQRMALLLCPSPASQRAGASLLPIPQDHITRPTQLRVPSCTGPLYRGKKEHSISRRSRRSSRCRTRRPYLSRRYSCAT